MRDCHLVLGPYLPPKQTGGSKNMESFYRGVIKHVLLG